MRGMFTKETRDFSKALNSDMKHVELDTAAEQKYIQDPSPNTYQSWQDLTRQFRILLTEQNTKKHLLHTRSLFEFYRVNRLDWTVSRQNGTNYIERA